MSEKTRELHVSRHFAAPAERVFDAWLDPARVGKWLFATSTARAARVELDARVGGKFWITDRRDGVDVPHVGEYLEIERPRRLSFTICCEHYSPHTYRVTVEIAPERTGCTLTLTQTLHPDDYPGFDESLRIGWLENLANAERVLIQSFWADSPAKARVTRRFTASAERVFDAWLDPKTIARWFAVGLGEMRRIDVDPRLGGRFSWVQRRGDVDVDHVGEYLELDRPRRLVFTWGVLPDAPDSRVVIDIAPLDDGCELTLVHEMPSQWQEFAPRSTDAWVRMTDAMAGVC